METTTAKASGSRRPAGGEEDRLSSLSDDLLHTIMSFLTSRQAVQTCVLSRRWVGLWCSVPCLNVDQREFNATDEPEYWTAAETPGTVRFLNFVDKLLVFQRAQSLNTFRLRVSNWHDGRKAADQCLHRAIEFCPEVLELCFNSKEEVPQFGWSFYRSDYELPPLGSSSCRLRRLHLVGIYLDKDFTLHLRSCCPALEDLELEGCLIAYPKIISSTLKNLAIIDCTTHCGHALTVTTPALISFHLVIIPTGSSWNGILADEMPSLVKASISFKYDFCTGRIPHRGPFKLLCSLVNMRNLELSGSETLWNNLQEGLDTFPTFPNLRTLVFNGCDTSDNFILECFLNNAPSLEKLIMQYCKLAEVSRKRKRITNSKMMSPELRQDPHAPAFECPSLRFTEIRYREGDFDELFGHLSGIWRNLQKSTITLTKA
ncbi:unnamed protein product [Urochloa decumbens]|uniref:At1g61320/AtMIF1 LRR domain-containing protein n=1 Tax=Urochloa decumbens TaxID=240449 RepID=A0ABC9D6P5_9POAL